ncbi:hypothetical protein [Maribellus maritimus]|uniref:hypothetical protein n=1 Tax=Maribellus maritimus TaxID=2870838 RepID=UPI001EEC6AFE|nr:hypothetical protein [Maribellus maritimus]MCG6188608.1 hypothetical protein [Maribellus maritimus]
MNRINMPKKFKIKHIFLLLLLIVSITIVVDLIRISNYELIPMRPAEKIDLQHNEIQYELANCATEINWNRLDGTLKYVKGEYDCSDFRLVNLIRILYEVGNQIPKDYKNKIEDVLFNFRYWWDEPGENSMCYWSENHQILFASAEYLIGQKYPDIVFPNSGLTGKQHMEKARKRILDWLEMRWNYGFIEFYSGTYYKEDVGALINLIDFAEEEISIKCRMIMDLLFYDVATQNINTMFVSVSGRAYKNNRTGGPGSTLGRLTNYFWGDGKEIGPGMMYGMMTTQKYDLPPVIAEIAKDSSDVIIRQSNGLDISDLKKEGYYGTDTRSMMMQWGMEAFTNPEVVRNSMKHIRNCSMFSNEFIGEFKILDLKVIDWLHLEPSLIRLLNPQPNGVAIQKGTTYTYKTKDYSMYTAQSYHPGTYGDQQHIFGMNIKNHFSIFHTHPAIEKDVENQSPNYWVGYGHIPHAMQDKNVNLSIYNIPEKKGMMEMDLLDYTRAYFPSEKFDTAYIDRNYVFGKKDETYCAFIGANNFEFRDKANDDVIQKGKQTFWITEAGSKTEDGSFEAFVKRIKNNKVSFSAETLELSYQSNGKTYQLKFGGDFMIDGNLVDKNYNRYDSPYAKAEKKDKTLIFSYNGKSLFLDFENLIRIYK